MDSGEAGDNNMAHDTHPLSPTSEFKVQRVAMATRRLLFFWVVSGYARKRTSGG